MTIRVFYHNQDLDGYCSGAIVKYRFPEAVMYPINYGDEFPWGEIAEDDEVFMVDFCLQPEHQMLKLYEVLRSDEEKEHDRDGNLCWIDHHVSAIKAMEDIGCYPYGRTGVSKAACELTWEYLFPNRPVPLAVKLLSAYDAWKQDIFIEQVVDLPGYEGKYKVSNLGKIWSYQTKEWMRPSLSSSGYEQVTLCCEGNQSIAFIHRLVAQTFLDIPNVPYDIEVNHKDFKKQNNRSDNLEWVSKQVNGHHAIEHSEVRNPASSYFGVGYRGNHKNKYKKQWYARLMVDGSRIFIGSYNTEREAAEAYNQFVVENGFDSSRGVPLNHFSKSAVVAGSDHWNAMVLPFQVRMRMEDLDPHNQHSDHAMANWQDFFDEPKHLNIPKLIAEGCLLLRYDEANKAKYVKTYAFETILQVPKPEDKTLKVRPEYSAIAVNLGDTDSKVFDSVWRKRCEECRGSGMYDLPGGYVPDTRKFECKRCNGTGYLEPYDLMITFVRQKDKLWNVSLYSTKPDVDCGAIAKSFGGGGHLGAAGFQRKELPFEY